MKGPSRKEETQKSGPKEFAKKKPNAIPTSFDEAKASCKARKRKERQESISSLCQERKVIRSNSEERPTQKKYLENKTIRRVSSSEDFQKSDHKGATLTQFIERNASPNRQNSDIILIYDEDCEHEKRRSHERFSKPLALKKKSHKSRRPKARCLPKPKFKPEITHEKDEVKNDSEEIYAEPFLQLHKAEKERSPSPVRLDLTTLHEQVDCSEPLLSCANHQIDEDTETLPGLSVASNRLLSSPRNSIIATHRIYLDPDVQVNFGLENKTQNPLELRLQKITKQINSTKKKIKKFESEFEAKHGYKVSHADKLNDRNIRQLYLELSKLKKEQKQLFDVCPNVAPEEDREKALQSSPRNLQDTLNDIERRLSQKRESAKRPHILEQMSNEELIDEKIAVQKALLYLESIHGRPDNKEDRNLARPIYDRYRILKRMIGKIQANPSGNELATIHEDETMTFVPSFTPQVSEIDSEKSSVMTSTDSSDTDTSISENLHSLTKFELIEQHRIVSEEKKELRRTIKVFEVEVQHKTGRMVQKEDKLPIENVYLAYKKVKAKLKLLDALVGKQL
ncbi:protein FAM13A isoform X2 [Tribolium castaneum]|uniref:FAM13A-like domain-containing protein n=2 Tax=Tribolium castaneum TaxID=7070 RepID=D6WJ89_TRICA|nr:PREDICTED: protein FAM13A isoform X2 [Tribolium castaneum]EFA03155.1 hypothetical protein TcasGA2_TC013074 [Tribolium castaneum]|eukprot:XP_975264.1 PREDICTED: protein FAM13A isoform X2 [Tribolium castaneum]